MKKTIVYLLLLGGLISWNSSGLATGPKKSVKAQQKQRSSMTVPAKNTKSQSMRNLGNVGSDVGREEAIPASAHLIGRDDHLLAMAATWYRKSVSSYDVLVHGTQNSFLVLHNGNWVSLSHRSLATFIRSKGWDGKTFIRLMSCYTGACKTGAAQNLANKLGVSVKAPDDVLRIRSDGRLTIGPHHNGNWINFTPRRAINE